MDLICSLAVNQTPHKQKCRPLRNEPAHDILEFITLSSNIGSEESLFCLI